MSGQDPVAAFRIEAADLLDQIEEALLDLGHRLDDRDLVDAVFRGLHTLKGSGAMFGFDALATFTHHCESAFDRVRKGLVPATQALVALDGSGVVAADAGEIAANLPDAEGRPIPFTRDAAQVLRTLTLSTTGIGGFLPMGANGLPA